MKAPSTTVALNNLRVWWEKMLNEETDGERCIRKHIQVSPKLMAHSVQVISILMSNSVCVRTVRTDGALCTCHNETDGSLCTYTVCPKNFISKKGHFKGPF